MSLRRNSRMPCFQHVKMVGSGVKRSKKACCTLSLSSRFGNSPRFARHIAHPTKKVTPASPFKSCPYKHQSHGDAVTPLESAVTQNTRMYPLLTKKIALDRKRSVNCAAPRACLRRLCRAASLPGRSVCRQPCSVYGKAPEFPPPRGGSLRSPARCAPDLSGPAGSGSS
jgi:hypothetical protein